MNLRIQKFGGTSMANVDTISRCVQIVKKASQRSQIVVVVSALGGVTDELLALIDLAKRHQPKKIAERLAKLEQRHLQTLGGFGTQATTDRVWQQEFAPMFERLRIILTGISYVGDVSERSVATVCSYGERISSRIMARALSASGVNAQRVRATRLIRTDSQYWEANVDFVKTRQNYTRILKPLLKEGITTVVPGFIGKDAHGDITLLGGRGGSDYTASISGLCLDADQIEIWSDVDGVMSADPRNVENVMTWETLEMSVMSELSHGGAKVLHPKTITAAVEKGIPVYVKNTFNTSALGTLIVQETNDQGVRGIALDAGQMLLHFEEPGMLSGIGFIRRIAEVFERRNIPLDVCSVSEVTFTLSIEEKYFDPQLLKELQKLSKTELRYGLAKISIIGSRIGADKTLLPQIFSVLGPYEVHAVSIGASDTNITILVDEDRANEIVNVLHTSLFSS